MNLDHKTLVLVNADGRPSTISDLKSLHLMVNNNLTPYTVAESDTPKLDFIREADLLNDSVLEGYSILFDFEVKSGYLVSGGMRIHFYDNESKQEIYVLKVAEPSIFMKKLRLSPVTISEEEIAVLMNILKDIAIQVETSKQEEASALEEIKESDNNVDVPIDQPQEVVSEETPANTEPVATEPSKEENQTIAQMEQNVIPDAIIEKYNGYRDNFINDGYKEYIYKNYRFFFKPFTDGKDAFLLLLTTERVAQVKCLEWNSSDDDVNFKYGFEIEEGSRKTLYLNTETSVMTIKRPKKSEKKNEATVVEEEVSLPAGEEVAPVDTTEQADVTSSPEAGTENA